jgi:deoxyribodipyrimidine photo-lyase
VATRAVTGGLQVVWFKRDLRVADHAALVAAAVQGPVLPLYIAEPALWAQPDAAARQWAFAAESLAELRCDLAHLGQPLVVRSGDTLDILQRLHGRHGIAHLWSHEETGNSWTYARDLAVGAWTRDAGIPWTELRQTGVIRRIKSRNGWAKAWDQQMSTQVLPAPSALPPLAGIESGAIPTAADLGVPADRCPERQRGGRTIAVATLASFLDARGRDYRFQMSSPVTAFEASSRVSPHLAWGTLSMREAAQATWTRMRDLKAATEPSARNWRGSLVSFSGRLHWHCHFMQKLEDEPAIEVRNLHRAYDGMRPEVADAVRLAAWSRGETGYPFIDACMRALKRHGWLNFRMRAMLMSFASYHLWLPWRDSGLHLARQFTDYEPGIHWPQTQMQSGTTGINTMRIYNPVKQGYDQDPAGLFVRAHVPELADVPDALLHEPWRWEHASALIGHRYPARIVDHETAGRDARERIAAVRRGPAHARAADAIQSKHGSRRSGMPMTGQKTVMRKKKPRPPARDTGQTEFDL